VTAAEHVPTEVALRLDIARGALATEVRLRGSARAVRDAFARGSEERRLAQPLLHAADRQVRAAVRAAHQAGCGTAELAAVVGVSRSRIHRILNAGPAHRADRSPDRSTGRT
jgi:hypothetical protein